MSTCRFLCRFLIASVTIVVPAAATLAQGPAWASPSVGPDARRQHAMAYDSARGRTVLFGGYRTGTGSLADTWEWDGRGWIRFTPPVSPPARAFHMMAFDAARGVTVLFGGIGALYYNDTWEWDGATWRQVLTANAPPTLEGAAMAYHAGANPCVLLFGGLGGTGYSYETWRYDGTNWTLAGGGGPSGRRGHAMCHASLTQQTYLHGGVDQWGVKNDLWAWNGAGWSQTVPAPFAPPPLVHHSMTFDEDREELVIVGGSNGGSPGPWGATLDITFFGLLSGGAVTPSHWFDPGNWDPTLSRYVPPGRIFMATVYDSARKTIVSFGGLEVDSLGAVGPESSMVYEVSPGGPNPFSEPWVERTRVGFSFSNPAPQPRIYTEMAFDPAAGRSILYGGWNGTTVLEDTWSFDGKRWTDHGTAGTAGPRLQPAMCYAPFVGTLMFGGGAGFSGPYYNDTLAWDGSSWFPTLTLGAPTPRYGHDMVYDSARNRVVLFGGYDASGSTNTTHELRPLQFGFEWNAIATNGTPPARHAHRLAYDSRRQRTVLFGGSSSAGIFLGDTWEYDGATAQWTQAFPAVSPPRRWNHVMDFDPARGVVVMTGGYGNPLCGNFCASHLDDIWEYDGTTWRQRTTGGTLPSGREGAAFAYDSAHQRFVMQGGSGSVSYPIETWLYNAPVDSQGQGMLVNPFPLRCTRFPIAGETSGFAFASADGLGMLVAMVQPNPSPLLVLGPTFLCGTGTLYAAPDILFPAPGNPGSTTVQLPASMAGLGFAVQGLTLDIAGGCFRLSDPLAVTVQAP